MKTNEKPDLEKSKLVFDATENSYREFKDGCKSTATLKAYTEALNKFMAHVGYTSYDNLARTELQQNQIEIQELKKKQGQMIDMIKEQIHKVIQEQQKN